MKISIPKEAIEKIMHDYGCSEKKATKAYLDAQDRAGEAFNAMLSEKLGPQKGKTEIFKVKIYTPVEIKQHLDKYIIGQEEYKKRLAIAAAYHFAIIKYLREHPEETSVKRFRKKNTIIAGPSGSGKTYSVEVLGDLLQVPTLTVDATDYTEAGYVGKSADDMIRELIDMAPGSTREERAKFIAGNGGLIFIDEIDKKAKDGVLLGHDISREGFQRSVLKLIERKQVAINNPHSAASQLQEVIDKQKRVGIDKKDDMISTENILFILGGSFERIGGSLDHIAKKRIDHKGRLKEDGSLLITGFAANEDREKTLLRNYYKEATADDFIKFGLIPELVGRAPIRTFVNLLSKNDLIRIMDETKDSILTQYQLEFKLFNIDLELTSEAIDCVAEISENQKTGARALVSVWENILTDFQFELPGSNFTKLVVTKELCKKPKDVLLKMLERSPFVDFVENFKKEYGIELIMEADVQSYIKNYAKKRNMQISEALHEFLSKASALNYMRIKGQYKITIEMLEDEKYFDKLFTRWYEKQKTTASK